MSTPPTRARVTLLQRSSFGSGRCAQLLLLLLPAAIMAVGGEVGPPPHRHHARRAAPRGHHHTDARAWRRGHPRHQRSRAAAQRERARDREVAVARGAFRESSGLARRAPASQTRPTWCASRSVHPQGQRSTNPKAAPTTPRAPHGGHFCRLRKAKLRGILKEPLEPSLVMIFDPKCIDPLSCFCPLHPWVPP